jgi:hypothetical protein
VLVTWILFAFGGGSYAALRTNSPDEGVEVIDYTLIEAVQLSSPFRFERGVYLDRLRRPAVSGA